MGLFASPPPKGEFVIVQYNLMVAERMPLNPHFAGMTKREIADYHHPSSGNAQVEVMEVMRAYEYDVEIEETNEVTVVVDFDTTVKFFRRRTNG